MSYWGIEVQEAFNEGYRYGGDGPLILIVAIVVVVGGLVFWDDVSDWWKGEE